MLLDLSFLIMLCCRKNQKAVSLFMVLTILSLMSAAILSLITVLLIQSKGMGSFSDSVIAFYAADTGIERLLYHIYQDDWAPAGFGECPYPWQDFSASVNNVAYEVCVSDFSTTTFWSTGEYKPTDVQRRIEINL